MAPGPTPPRSQPSPHVLPQQPMWINTQQAGTADYHMPAAWMMQPHMPTDIVQPTFRHQMAAPHYVPVERCSTEGNNLSANNCGCEQQSGHPQMSVMYPAGSYPWVWIPPAMGSPVMNPHVMGSSHMAPPSMGPPDMYQPVVHSPGVCPSGMAPPGIAPPDVAPPGMAPGLGQWRPVFFPAPPSQPVDVVPSPIKVPNQPTVVSSSSKPSAPSMPWMRPQWPKPQPIYQEMQQQQQQSPVVTYAPPAREPPQPTVILKPTALNESQHQICAPNERLCAFDDNAYANNSGRCRVRPDGGVVIKGATGTHSKSSQTVGRRCSIRIKERERCGDFRNMELWDARRRQRGRHCYNELRNFVPMNFRIETPGGEIEHLVPRTT